MGRQIQAQRNAAATASPSYQNYYVPGPNGQPVESGVTADGGKTNATTGKPIAGSPVLAAPSGMPTPATPDAPKWTVLGEDQFGNKVYGYPPAPGAAPSAPSAAAPSAAAPVVGAPAAVAPGAPPAPDPAELLNLHGADFLAKLDPGTAAQVKAIIEGRAPYPTGMLLKTPYGQRLAQYVTQADPTFEQGNATARVAARKDFETGGPNGVAGTITAGNTAIQHLGQLSDIVEKLGNADSGIPGNNSTTRPRTQSASCRAALRSLSRRATSSQNSPRKRRNFIAARAAQKPT